MRPRSSTTKDIQEGSVKIPDYSAVSSQLESETERKIFPAYTYVFMYVCHFFLGHFSSFKNTEKLKSKCIKTEHYFKFKYFILTKTEFITILTSS